MVANKASDRYISMCGENGYTRSFNCNDNFMVIIVFSVDVVNTKVVGNMLILLVLNFYDFRIIGLRVIDFTNTLSIFVYVLDSAVVLCLFD